MEKQLFKKPTCIVDFDSEFEIENALLEWVNDFKNWKIINFENFLIETTNFKNNLFKNV